MNLAKALMFFLLFFLFTGPSTGDIRFLRLQSDNRKFIPLQRFGFTNTGHLSIAISSVSVTSLPVTSSYSKPDPSRIGFFLVPDYLGFAFAEEGVYCHLDSKYITLLFTFQDLSPPPQSSFNKSFPVTYPDRYTLIYDNCNPVSFLTMDVRTEMFNTENNTTKDYISDGLRQLPALYSSFSIIYMCILVFWSYLCFKNRSSFNMIHLAMAGLLVMKVLNYIYAAEDQYHMKVTGTHHEWNVMFHLFQFVRAMLLFIVIQNISTRLPFLDPFWEKDMVTMIKMIPLQVLAILASVACILMEETGPFFTDRTAWIYDSMALNFICFLVMFLPFGCWCDRADRTTDFTESHAYLVSISSWVGIGCVMFGRYVAWLTIDLSAPYKYWWLFNALGDASILVFYTVTVYMLRPLNGDGKIDARYLELEL